MARDDGEPGYGCLFGLLMLACAAQALAGASWLGGRHVVALALMLGFTVVLVFGCAVWAREQGRHPAWGMLGALGLAGMLLLLILPELEASADQKRQGFSVLGLRAAIPMDEGRDTMRVHVRLFAAVRERAGESELVLELPPGATIADAAQALAERFPGVGSFLPRVAYALNESYTKPDAVLNDGDELAVIPPVSGG